MYGGSDMVVVSLEIEMSNSPLAAKVYGNVLTIERYLWNPTKIAK